MAQQRSEWKTIKADKEPVKDDKKAKREAELKAKKDGKGSVNK